MRIGVLAARAGISPSRIRFYEAEGVLPQPVRLASGYRDYDENALQILHFIARGQSLGFSLGELAAHIQIPEKGKARKRRLIRKVEDKLREIEALSADLAKKRVALLAVREELLHTQL